MKSNFQSGSVSDTYLCIQQEIAITFGGKVDAHTHREYGPAKIQVKKTGNPLADRLFDGIDAGADGMQVRAACSDEHKQRLIMIIQ